MNLGLKAQSFLKIDLFAKLMILAKGTKKKNNYFDKKTVKEGEYSSFFVGNVCGDTDDNS